MEVYLLKGNGDSHIPQVDINGNGLADREFWYNKAMQMVHTCQDRFKVLITNCVIAFLPR